MTTNSTWGAPRAWRARGRKVRPYGAEPGPPASRRGRLPPAAAVVRAGPEPARAFDLVRCFSLAGLLCIGLVAAGASLGLSRLLTDRMLGRDAAVSAEFLNSIVSAERTWPDLRAPGPGPVLASFFNHVAHLPDVVRANVFARDGIVIWSSTPGLVGRRPGPNPELDEALAGRLAVESGTVGVADKAEHVDFAVGPGTRFVETYVPIRDEGGGGVVGVVEIYRLPRALFAAIDEGRRLVWLGALAGGGLLYAVLLGVVGRAACVMRRQEELLAETEALAAVGSVASTVAHNIRNPLASIRSSAELAWEDEAGLGRGAAADIMREVDRLDGWIRGFLRSAREEDPSDAGRADLAEAAREALEGLRPAIARRGVALEVELGGSPPPPAVVGRHEALAQVVDILATNALDAMPRGGRLRVGVRAASGRRGGREPGGAVLRVADTGEGLPRDRLRHVFRPFFTTKRDGVGLGLALARGTVTRLGGTIELASAPGRGTVATVRLPAAG